MCTWTRSIKKRQKKERVTWIIDWKGWGEGVRRGIYKYKVLPVNYPDGIREELGRQGLG